MSYEYTDHYGDTLTVETDIVGNATVDANSVDIKPEDAPAVALAILEVAGITDGVGTGWHGGQAVAHLKVLVRENAERAEREAEDAKVQEWLDARNAEFGATDHWELDDAARAGYRASKAFWEKHLGTRDEGGEKEQEPRVLQHGDPEPDRDTRWIKAAGEPITHNGEGWVTRYKGAVPLQWSQYTPDQFPMTEVTE